MSEGTKKKIQSFVFLGILLSILTFALFLCLHFSSANAEDAPLYSGTCGSVGWTIDSDGTLIFSPVSGSEGTLDGTAAYDGDFRGGKMWQWNYTSDRRSAIKSVRFTGTIHSGYSLDHFFEGCENLSSIDFAGFDTSPATSTRSMFFSCKGLKNVDLSSFDTFHVTDMSWMFFQCNALDTVTFGNMDTSHVTSMAYMFYFDQNLTNLDVSRFNTGNVTDMQYMFFHCEKLPVIDVSHFDTRNVTNFCSMFAGDTAVKELNVTGFETEKAENMASLFAACESVISLDLSNFKTEKVTTMREMFYDCPKLTTLDLSSFDTRNVTDLHGMFNLCRNLQTIAWNSELFRTDKVTDMGGMFYCCNNLKTVDTSQWNTGNVTDMGDMFSYCYALNPLDVSGWDVSKVVTMQNMFYRCQSLTALDVSHFVTSSCENMADMFNMCLKVQTLDTGKFDTSHVDSLENLFFHCESAKTINVSSFDTRNVKNMNSVFSGCYAVESLDVKNWDTSNVTNMNSLFAACYVLPSLDLSGFQTRKVTNMTEMFYYDRSIGSLDLSSFTTANVTSFLHMFIGMSGLQRLNINGFNTESASNMGGMFDGCPNLKEVMIGPGFSFRGNGITDTSSMAIFPTPSGTKYTGKWTNGTAVLTPSELQKSSADLSGTWDWEIGYEVYAAYTPTDRALTFFRDEQGKYENGANGTYMEDPNSTFYTGIETTEWKSTPPWGEKEIDTVDFKCEVSPISTWSWFVGQAHLATLLHLDRLDTSHTIYMGQMFLNCTGLQQIDLSTFDMSQVVNCLNMFSNCTSLTSVTLGDFHAEKVQNFSGFFNEDYNLKTVAGTIYTRDVTDLSRMFKGCSKLQAIDLSGFSTAQCTDMEKMFLDCADMKALDISTFDTGNVTTLYEMFSNCGIQSLKHKELNLSKAADLNSMFESCKLKSLDLSGTKWPTCETTVSSMFSYLPAETIDLGECHIETATSTRGMFIDSYIKKIKGTIYTRDAIDMSSMFAGCTELEHIELPHVLSSQCTNLGSMFSDCRNLKTADISGLSVKDSTVDEDGMFYLCDNLESITLGQGFSFTKQGLLPYGYWTRSDHAYGPCTARKLETSYNGASMAGIWNRSEAYEVTVPASVTFPKQDAGKMNMYWGYYGNLSYYVKAGHTLTISRSLNGMTLNEKSTSLALVPGGKPDITIQGNATHEDKSPSQSYSFQLSGLVKYAGVYRGQIQYVGKISDTK